MRRRFPFVKFCTAQLRRAEELNRERHRAPACRTRVDFYYYYWDRKLKSAGRVRRRKSVGENSASAEKTKS
jgi:hypothetical protein